MNCEGFLAEEYGDYVLGLAEEAQADRIRAHIEAGCEVCRHNIRETEAVWYLFALAGDEPLPTAPPFRLRLAGQRPAWLPLSSISMGWQRGLAFAGGVLVTVATWSIVESVPRLPEHALVNDDILRKSQRDTTYWKDRATTAEQSLQARQGSPVVPPVIPPQAPPAAPASTADNGLAAELASARLQSQTAADLLARERVRSADLQTQIDTQRALLASTQQRLTETETRADRLTREVAGGVERERQLQALATQVQQLERQNATYRETLVRLEGQMQRSTQMAAFFGSPTLKMAALQPTEAGGRSAGRAYVVEGQKVVFYASQLPALPAGRCYQLWLIRSKGPAIASGGVFKPDARRNSALEVSDTVLSTGVRGVAVTEEPDGGSPGPTGHKIMAGTISGL